MLDVGATVAVRPDGEAERAQFESKSAAREIEHNIYQWCHLALDAGFLDTARKWGYYLLKADPLAKKKWWRKTTTRIVAEPARFLYGILPGSPPLAGRYFAAINKQMIFDGSTCRDIGGGSTRL